MLPNHTIPHDNAAGKHHGLDRHHPIFAEYMEEQRALAPEALAGIPEANTTAKAMPKSVAGPTVDADGTSRRHSPEFEMNLEAESARIKEMIEHAHR